jgi:DNA-binding Lrp family transcriptional regulator
LKAYVLINTELGQEAAVIDVIKNVKEITATYALYGIYDVIVEVEADTMDRVKEIVFNDIRRLENVKSTITLITYGETEEDRQ